MAQDNTPVAAEAQRALSSLDLLVPVAEPCRPALSSRLAVGLVALGIGLVVPRPYTARTSFVPPRQKAAAARAWSLRGVPASLAAGGGSPAPASPLVGLLQQGQRGWFGAAGKAINVVGTRRHDASFVPEDASKTKFLQNAKHRTQMLNQLGWGVASIKVSFQ